MDFFENIIMKIIESDNDLPPKNCSKLKVNIIQALDSIDWWPIYYLKY